MEKKYLTKGLLLKILGCCVFMGIVFYFSANHQIHYNQYNVYQNFNDGNVGGIVDGTNIKQVFRYSGDYIRSINVKVGTYARTNTGTLQIALKEESNGQVIWQGQQSMSELEDNSDMKLAINSAVNDSTEYYRLEIQSDGATKENSITIYSSTLENVYEGILYINSEEVNAELQMSIYGDNINSCGRYYWWCVVVLLIFIIVFYGVQQKKEKSSNKGWLHNLCYTLDTYKFMMKQLISRDFKTKYKRSVLGMFWSFLNPLLTMLVQYIVFSTIFRSDIENYPVYLLSASILFSFFTEAVGGGLISIVGNASLIKKVYAPKYIYPITKVLSTSINLLISLLPLFVVVLFTGEHINKAYLLIPYVLICLIAFAIGMSLILSSLMVFFRDVQFLWSIVSLLWMYATPMFYPESIIPERFRFVLDFNPMYHYITFFRTILLDGFSPSMNEYVCCAFFSMLFCVIGAVIFNHTQKRFVLHL